MISISSSRKQEIESVTKDILTSVFGVVNSILPPIDLNQILAKYGITLKAGKFDDSSVSGAFDRETNTIFLSDSDPIQRQTFTVGHELGHFLLHKNKKKEVFKRVQAIQLDYAGPDDQAEEVEANYFAATLIMPTDLVRTYWVVMKETEHLSTLFGVSETAVYWRLKNLGLIKE